MQDNTITNQHIMNTLQQNNTSSIKRCVITLLLLLLISTSFSQTYPVQVNSQVIPPYSVKLSDYATITSEKIYVNLLLTDLNEVGRRVKLRFYVEGNGLNVQSNDIVAGEPVILLDGGVNTRLSNLDLKPYFELNNLSGISPNQYSNPLPDGGYSYCFEVLDYFTGRKLSQKSCTTIYLQQNNPPILNVPFKDDVVTFANPQNVLFTWTPRHTNAPNVQYEFTIKELWDTNMNPQTTFLASPIFYQTTTYTPTLLLGPAEPQLLAGKVYAWQVRAFVNDGVNEIASFRNDGRSEIFWFKYVEDCHPPTYVLSEALTAQSVKVQWQTSDHLKYRIQYRKKGFDSEDDWFEVNSYTTEGTIHNLEPATTYEFRVGGQCTELSGYVYSTIQEFTTPNENEETGYNCGVMPSFELDNTNPLPQLHRNDVFTAGDFPVTVKDVKGENGTFSGWGYIVVPYLGDTKIKVGFESVQINTAYQLTSGLVETDYSANWENIGSIDETIETFTGNNGEVKQYDASNLDLANVIVTDSGNVVLVGEDGQEYPIETTKPVTVTDKNGDQWTAHEDGTVTKGQAAEGGVPNQNNTNGVNSEGDATAITSKDVEVIFKPSGYYVTDNVQANLSAQKYRKQYQTLTSSNGDYEILYKLVSNTPNQEDEITAEVSLTNGFTTDDIVFKTQRGSKVPVTWSGNTATLTLKNQFKFAKEALLATVKPKDSTGKYEVAGKLNLWHAQQRTVNVTLIGVNGQSVEGLKEKLNQIYNPAGINFKVTKKNFTITEQDWDIDNAGQKGVLDIGDSDVLANYTPEERAIFKKYKEENGVSGQEYYLFVIGDKIPTSKSLEGFMPLAHQYGFIFNAGDIGKTVAHELGHGIFGLKHPFDEYGTDEYENTYLMSYGSGTKFTHMDWQKLHAPGLQFYIFQGDSDGESATILKKLPKKFTVLHNEKRYYPFLTPNNKKLYLPYDTTTKPSFYYGIWNNNWNDVIPGVLIGFTHEDEQGNLIKYSASVKNGKFNGYFKGNDQFEYKPVENFNSGKVVMGLPRGVTTDKGLIVAEYNYITDQYSTTSGDLVKVQDLDFYPTTNATDIEYYSIRDLRGEGQEQLSETYLSTIRDALNSKEFLTVLKIAEWNNRYENGFKKFTSTWNDWKRENVVGGYIDTGDMDDPSEYVDGYYYGHWNGKMAEDNERLFNLYKTDKYAFYTEFLNELEKYLMNYQEEIRGCLDQIDPNQDTVSTNSNIKDCIKNASEDDIQQLSYDKRMKAIKDIMAEFLVGNNDELLIVKLLKHRPQNFDNNKFIESLKTDCTLQLQVKNRDSYEYKTICFWDILFEKVNDGTFVFRGDNRKKLIRELATIYYKTENYRDDFEKITDAINNYNTKYLTSNGIQFTNDYQNILRRAFTHIKNNFYIFSPDDSYLSIDTKVDRNVNPSKVIVDQSIKTGFIDTSLYKDTYSPFDLVLFSNLSKQQLLSDYSQNDKNGKPLVMAVPIIVLHYASEVGNGQTAGDIIQTTFDFVTLVIPGAQIAQLGKLGKVFYYADKISSVTSIGATAMRDENDELYNLLNQVSTVTGVISLGDLASSSIKQIAKSDNLVKSADDVVNDANKLLEIVEQSGNSKLLKATSVELAHVENALHQTKKLESYGVSISRVNNAIRKINNVNKGEFLNKLKNYPELLAKYNVLENTATKQKFIDDFITADDTLLKALQKDEAFNLWKRRVETYPEGILCN